MRIRQQDLKFEFSIHLFRPKNPFSGLFSRIRVTFWRVTQFVSYALICFVNFIAYRNLIYVRIR